MLWPKLARALVSRPLTDPPPPVSDEIAVALRQRLDAAAQARLGRSLAIRHVDAGSCNGCELEINALANVAHDLERFGLRFVASPRHADVLLVTGPLTRNMRVALERARAATQVALEKARGARAYRHQRCARPTASSIERSPSRSSCAERPRLMSRAIPGPR